MNPFPLILSSPSGGGKTTIRKMLLSRRADVGYSISCTTRAIRPGESEGIDYHFLSPAEFTVRRERSEFAESAEVHGNFYGTLRSEVDRICAVGKHVVMDIDVQGARQFHEAYPESVLVFLLPPSVDVLLSRLLGRKTEDENAVRTRLASAREEMAAIGAYQYVVVNDDLERAYEQVSAIVDAETVRHRRVPRLDERIDALVHELDRQISLHTAVR